MTSDKRLTRLLIVTALIAAPAAALRFACVGHACDESRPQPKVSVPFCSLPGDVRGPVVAGYRHQRSPEALAVTKAPSLIGQVPDEPTGAAPLWPWLRSPDATRVPIVIAGPRIPNEMIDLGLEDVAPTAAEALGVNWQFPQYRTGEPARMTAGPRAPLAVFIAWKGVGSDLIGTDPGDAPRVFRTLLRDGTGSLTGTTGSLPVDSTASLTTAGSGAPPRVHGITGTLLRNEASEVVEAWSPRGPYAVVNALGDALDSDTRGDALVGLVGTAPFDRGLIGGTWFEGVDSTWTNDDDMRIVRPSRVAAEAETMLIRYGADDVPDLLGITLEGSPKAMDAATERILAAVRDATDGQALVAVFGTGSQAIPADATPRDATIVETAIDGATGVDVVAAMVPGGVFLDRDAMAAAGTTTGQAIGALKELPGMADAFPAFAITLERFC